MGKKEIPSTKFLVLGMFFEKRSADFYGAVVIKMREKEDWLSLLSL